jgi:tetratricopeptide (TPR) repeat protein
MFAILCAGAIDGIAQKKKAVKETEAKPVEPVAEQQPQEESELGDPVLEHYMKKYALASRWNDTQVAKSAMYDMIILRPKDDSLLFNLGYFYFDNRQFAPAMLVSQDLLARNVKNLSYLELSAASFEALGILDRSLQNYESIYLLSNNTMALYKIAFLQFDMKRYEECSTNIEILLTKPEAETIKIGYSDTTGQPKEFPMKWPLLSLKGLILQDNGNVAGARKQFEDIIKQVPDFQPAVENLAKLNKK